MALTPNPKKDPRPVAVTIRLSKRGTEQLRKLSAILNQSQGEIVDQLIDAEFKVQERKSR